MYGSRGYLFDVLPFLVEGSMQTKESFCKGRHRQEIETSISALCRLLRLRIHPLIGAHIRVTKGYGETQEQTLCPNGVASVATKITNICMMTLNCHSPITCALVRTIRNTYKGLIFARFLPRSAIRDTSNGKTDTSIRVSSLLRYQSFGSVPSSDI